jgi:hypothetical protein
MCAAELNVIAKAGPHCGEKFRGQKNQSQRVSSYHRLQRRSAHVDLFARGLGLPASLPDGSHGARR